MATNKKELKDGDKLYYIMYYDFDGEPERKLESYTIKKIKGNRIYLKGGYHWTFSLTDLGDKIFASKSEAVEHTLKLHKEKLEELEDEMEPLQKEIKYLEKKLHELKE
jgi:phage shock protein A